MKHQVFLTYNYNNEYASKILTRMMLRKSGHLSQCQQQKNDAIFV